MDASHPLINLAADPSRSAREALVAATVGKLLDTIETPSPAEQKLFSDILVKLYAFARHEIREKLSTALATSDWAPPELVRELALDTYNIAQPVITFCPTITDDILIEVVEARDLEHRVCIAERACIGENVCAKLIDTGNSEVIGTLARNVTAKISAHDFGRAIEVVRSRQSDLDAMVLRHDLPPCFIALAYSLAGEKTRLTLSLRLPTQIEQRLARLTAAVASDLADGFVGETQTKTEMPIPPPTSRKIAPSPTPGILIAALMRGERDVFFDGLSTLLSLPRVRIQQQIMRGDVQAIALVSRAANFDMTIVRTIHETLQSGRKTWSASDDKKVAMLWMRHSPVSARVHFATGSAAA
jgi:uncharacterized protein (DUF2336 family)